MADEREPPEPAGGGGREDADLDAVLAPPVLPARSRVEVAQTVAGLAAPDEPLAVLVLAPADVQAAVRDALKDPRFELLTTAEADVAVDVLGSVAPDVVLVDERIAGQDAHLLTRLRSEGGARVRGVVLSVPPGAPESEHPGVDAVLQQPFEAAELRAMVGLAARESGPEALAALRSGTVEQIAAGVAEVVRRGVVESLHAGADERIELKDATELLAAAWSAVGRVRAQVVLAGRGKVRFRDAPGVPVPLALTDELPAAPYAKFDEVLKGRRVLVADDDPAVRWFFGGLLREAGALVTEARDGREALGLARRNNPDVVISDILMPEIDGFSLCRELSRDHALSHVPVILLSWKEDFLQRMRELDAHAAGYLRKEVGSHQVLSTVSDVLAPRAQIESQLAAGGEARGDLVHIGARALIETAARQQRNVRIVVQDAGRMFEVGLRVGGGFAISRTASDGTFARGDAALHELLGATHARFTVTNSDEPLRGEFAAPLDRVLADATTRLGAMLDAVSDRRLLAVARVTFRDDVLASVLTGTPTALAGIVSELRSGERDAGALITSGSISSDELEGHLRELVRYGAIERVLGMGGEDLVASALEARRAHPEELMHVTQPGTNSVPPAQLNDDEVELIDDEEQEITAEVENDELIEDLDDAELVIEAEQDEDEAAVAAAPHAPSADAPPAQQRSAWGLLGMLALAMVLGYVGWGGLRACNPTIEPFGPWSAGDYDPQKSKPAVQVGPPEAAAVEDAPAPQALAQARRADGRPTSEAPPPPSEPIGLGRALPFIDKSRGVEVADDQGLLVLEHTGQTEPVALDVDGKAAGKTPVQMALPEGRHEVTLRQGKDATIRYVFIRAGQTRIVELPLKSAP